MTTAARPDFTQHPRVLAVVDTAQRAHDQLFPTRHLLQTMPDPIQPICDAIDLIDQARAALRDAGAR